MLSDVSTDRDSVQGHKQFVKKKVIFLFTVVLMEWNPTVSTNLSVTSVGSVFGMSFSATLVCNKMFYNPYLVSYDYWLSSCYLVKTSAGGRTIWRFQFAINLEGFHNLLSISITITFIYKMYIMTWTSRSKWCSQLDGWCWLDELLTWLLFGCPYYKQRIKSYNKQQGGWGACAKNEL